MRRNDSWKIMRLSVKPVKKKIHQQVQKLSFSTASKIVEIRRGVSQSAPLSMGEIFKNRKNFHFFRLFEFFSCIFGRHVNSKSRKKLKSSRFLKISPIKSGALWLTPLRISTVLEDVEKTQLLNLVGWFPTGIASTRVFFRFVATHYPVTLVFFFMCNFWSINPGE